MSQVDDVQQVGIVPNSQSACEKPLQPSDVAHYYDVWTEKYMEAFGSSIQAHRPTKEKDLLDYLMERAGLRDGMLVLDAGSGTCGPARHFAKNRRVRIEALTISPIQVAISCSRNQAEGLDSRIHVQLGDFHRLSEIYLENVFDLVYFLESLSHSAEPRRVLESVYKVLKPGGLLYIKDFFIRPCESFEEQQRVLEVVARVDRIFSTKTAWAEDMKRHLSNAGFDIVFAEKPQFEVDNAAWQWFEQKHQFDLFAGAEPFDWSEWLEIKSQKK